MDTSPSFSNVTRGNILKSTHFVCLIHRQKGPLKRCTANRTHSYSTLKKFHTPSSNNTPAQPQSTKHHATGTHNQTVKQTYCFWTMVGQWLCSYYLEVKTLYKKKKTTCALNEVAHNNTINTLSTTVKLWKPVLNSYTVAHRASHYASYIAFIINVSVAITHVIWKPLILHFISGPKCSNRNTCSIEYRVVKFVIFSLVKCL